MKNGCIIDANGTKYWYVNGKCHRDNDLPAIECADGNKGWCVNGIPQPDKIAKCCWIIDQTQIFKWHETIDKARSHMGQLLSEGICAWIGK